MKNISRLRPILVRFAGLVFVIFATQLPARPLPPTELSGKTVNPAGIQIEEPVSDGVPEQAAQKAVPVANRYPKPPAFTGRQPAEEPLRITFPTPEPAPISAWRPALYPTPWALGPFDHFYFSRPIAANEKNWPLADYRYGGVFIEGVVHTGIDIPTPIGTPVLATGPGKVTWAGYGMYYGVYNETDPYGMAVLIKHDFGYQGQRLYTAYGHLSEVDVVKGQYVEQGELIGLSGETGAATGPHLHYEVRLEQGGFFSTRNPELWLVPAQGWGVLVGQLTSTGSARLQGLHVTLRSKETGQNYEADTYTEGPVRSDPYYQENLVISDLPAGLYEIQVYYFGKKNTQDIIIRPGAISYFSFHGRNGFSFDMPPVPGLDSNPAVP